MTKQCRVCFESESADRVLCAPCACEGTGKWICVTCMMNDVFRENNTAPGKCGMCTKMYCGVSPISLITDDRGDRYEPGMAAIMCYIVDGDPYPNLSRVPLDAESISYGAKFFAKILCVFTLIWLVDCMVIGLIEGVWYFVSRSDSYKWILCFVVTISLPLFLASRMLWNCFSLVLQVLLSLSSPEHRRCLTLFVCFRYIAHFVPTLVDLIKAT